MSSSVMPSLYIIMCPADAACGIEADYLSYMCSSSGLSLPTVNEYLNYEDNP